MPHPLTWGNHDLVLVCPDSQEGEVIGGVKISHCTTGLGGELLNLTGILNCCGIIESAADRNTFRGERERERGIIVVYAECKDVHYCIHDIH